jgi:hypothetical protein
MIGCTLRNIREYLKKEFKGSSGVNIPAQKLWSLLCSAGKADESGKLVIYTDKKIF